MQGQCDNGCCDDHVRYYAFFYTCSNKTRNEICVSQEMWESTLFISFSQRNKAPGFTCIQPYYLISPLPHTHTSRNEPRCWCTVAGSTLRTPPSARRRAHPFGSPWVVCGAVWVEGDGGCWREGAWGKLVRETTQLLPEYELDDGSGTAVERKERGAQRPRREPQREILPRI